jgi:hypothetical protein
MISWPPLSRLLVPAVAALALAGCGSQTRLQGHVRYGGEPVDMGGIGFLLEGAESTPENRATGIIQGGRYTLEKGPAPGAYRVQIYWHKKTGRKIGPPDQATDERKQAIPLQYNEKTELKVEVKPGRNTLDFDLPAVSGPVESAAGSRTTPKGKPQTPDR